MYFPYHHVLVADIKDVTEQDEVTDTDSVVFNKNMGCQIFATEYASFTMSTEDYQNAKTSPQHVLGCITSLVSRPVGSSAVSKTLQNRTSAGIKTGEYTTA